MRPTRLYIVTMGLLLAAAPAMGALTAEQKCQAGKNQAAGKYADCRQKAEASLVKTGDTTKYAAAISKCETKFQTKWQKLIDTATAAGATCPDAPLTRPDFQSVIDEHTDNIAQALSGGGLGDCSGDLATCTTDLSTCNGSLSTCTGNLGTCNTSLTTCSTSLATCNAGTATAGDVLAGETFSSGSGLGLTGTMPNNGGVSIVPGTAAQPIAAGYHDGTGTVAGDTDLVAGNITSGVTIFGVTGTAPSSTCGNGVKDGAEQCDAADLGGQTCAGLGYALGGTLSCTAGCGFNTAACSGQAFPESGQTTCWNSSGTVIPCSGTGHDGDIRAGAPLAYQDNADGTITDLNTKLMWAKKSDDGTIHDKDTNYTWDNAYATYIAALNTPPGFAGHTDWRLPNIKELQSIVNYEIPYPGPTVHTAFNTSCTGGCSVTACSCTAQSLYWSSTTLADTPQYAWVVYFNYGTVGASFKTYGYRVRAVRGGL